MHPAPIQLLARLTHDLEATLGADLRSLAVHGSFVAGDYCAGRSDLDLLALVARDPDPLMLARLTEVHRRIVHDHPDWDDHIEVDYVSPAAVGDVLAGAAQVHQMARISPGESLHLTTATRHFLMNWASAVSHDHVLARAAPGDLLPTIDDDAVRAVLLEHTRSSPEWVGDMRTPDAQAYAVLTVCRCAATLQPNRVPATGPVSKRAGAAYGLLRWPRWADLVRWAEDLWYSEGVATEVDRLEETTAFVRDATSAILEDGTAGDVRPRRRE